MNIAAYTMGIFQNSDAVDPLRLSIKRDFQTG